jgi:hypothetical protein
MSLCLTPDILAAAYDFLRATEPFAGWRLPDSDIVGFHILRTRQTLKLVGVEEVLAKTSVTELVPVV